MQRLEVIDLENQEKDCQARGGASAGMPYVNPRRYMEAAVVARQGFLGDNITSLHDKGRLSLACYTILRLPVYYITMFVVAALLMALSIIEDPNAIIPEDRKPAIRLVSGCIELILLSVILADAIIRMLYIGPKKFYKHKILILNVIVIFLMYLEVLVAMGRYKEPNTVRVLRALRPLFLIVNRLMANVHRVLKQIFESLKPIFDVLVLLFFVVAIFAIFGFYFFAGVDKHYFSSYGQSFVSMFVLQTTANFPDVMMEAYNKVSLAPIFFVFFLVFSLYLLSNVLLSVVYSNFQSHEKARFKRRFLHRKKALEVAYKTLATKDGVELQEFFPFMARFQPQLPNWQVLCVYKAMKHKDSDDDLSPLTLQQFYTLYDFLDLVWIRVDEYGNKLLWYTKLKPAFVMKTAQAARVLVNWQWFNSTISVIIVVNTLINVALYLYHLDDLGYFSDAIAGVEGNVTHLEAIQGPVLTGFSIFFIIIYVLEITVRIVGLGPNYFTNFWNWFDFIIVGISFLAVLLEISPALKFAVFFRPLRLIRLLRLKRRYREILNTLGVLIPQILSVFILVVVNFYFFGIIGMEAFKGFVSQGCCENAWFFAGNYYQASRNETDPNVYFLNSFDSIFHSYVTLFILMVVNNWFVIMEGFSSQAPEGLSSLARVYFIAFYVVSLIVTVVIVSYIVEAFCFKIDLAEVRQKKMRFCRTNHKGDDCLCTLENDDNLKITPVRLSSAFVNQGLSFSSGRRYAFGVRGIQQRMRESSFPQKELELEHNELMYHGIRLWTPSDLYKLMYEKEVDCWIKEHEWSQNEAADLPLKTGVTRVYDWSQDAIQYIFE